MGIGEPLPSAICMIGRVMINYISYISVTDNEKQQHNNNNNSTHNKCLSLSTAVNCAFTLQFMFVNIYCSRKTVALQTKHWLGFVVILGIG